MNDQEALGRVLTLTGLGLPRGVLGPETWALAAALGDDADPAADLAGLADAAAAAHWPALRGPMEAALLRAAGSAEGEDAEAFAVVLEWAADDDPDSPLPRALAVRAASELAAAGARARARLRAAQEEVAAGGEAALTAAARAAGAMAVDLLDLDPEDFATEIAAYAAGDQGPDEVDSLARATGDPEIREWARGAVAALDDDAAPAAADAVAALASGPPPDDPADDLLWVATILWLAQEGIERALVDEGAGPGPGMRDEPDH